MRAGLRGALLELDEADDPSLFAAAVRVVAREHGVALADVVPGARTVLVRSVTPEGLEMLLALLPAPAQVDHAGYHLPDGVLIEVRYDGADLSAVAQRAGMSTDEVVRRHVASSYRAAFTGFAPGFAYLTGLDPALQLPRLDTPRAAVPAGSLAVADTYTAVYPRRSPGGWHLIGTVDVAVFDPLRVPSALISPGQTVRFVEAS